MWGLLVWRYFHSSVGKCLYQGEGCSCILRYSKKVNPCITDFLKYFTMVFENLFLSSISVMEQRRLWGCGLACWVPTRAVYQQCEYLMHTTTYIDLTKGQTDTVSEDWSYMARFVAVWHHLYCRNSTLWNVGLFVWIMSVSTQYPSSRLILLCDGSSL